MIRDLNTPWTYGDYGMVYGKDGEIINPEFPVEYISSIVIAVNSHNQMVEALIQGCLSLSLRYGHDGDKGLGVIEVEKEHGGGAANAYNLMRGALENA